MLAAVLPSSPFPSWALPFPFCPALVCLMAARQHEQLEVVCTADDPAILYRPCVDCGRRTGCFCDYCEAADRLLGELWVEGQHTPLCRSCDHTHVKCHFCRGVQMARPFAWGGKPDFCRASGCSAKDPNQADKRFDRCPRGNRGKQLHGRSAGQANELPLCLTDMPRGTNHPAAK